MTESQDYPNTVHSFSVFVTMAIVNAYCDSFCQPQRSKMAKLTAKLSVIVTNDFCDTFTFRQHCHNKQATLYSVHRNFTVFLRGGVAE